jgi:uncharacterized protein (DUF1810 family)
VLEQLETEAREARKGLWTDPQRVAGRLLPTLPFPSSHTALPYRLRSDVYASDSAVDLRHLANEIGVWAQPMNDDCHLHRFLEAQDHVYEAVLDELRAGKKHGHWMWYIFPQIRGLGHSGPALKFAITSLEEAKAYLQHPVLGPRLRECSQLVINVEGHNAEEIFCYPDNLKFRSCMTLFMTATTDNNVFKEALLKYFEGKPDKLTLDLLHKD